MAVVTVNGQIGAGGNEVGLRVARLLDADYVDRLILSESAKRIGSTVQVLEMKEQRSMPLRDRLASFLQSVLERSAISGVGGEPYFAPGMEYLPAYEYTELAQEEPLTSAQRLNNDRFMEVTSAVIRDLASGGNVVLIGRGSNMILHGEPKVFHVGLVAPLDMRITVIQKREHLSYRDAEKYVNEVERARQSYYRKFFKAQQPDDPSSFDLILNMVHVGHEAASEIVAQGARSMNLATVDA